MEGQVSVRPVLEDDLSWLAGLRNDPAATGLHEWHGWRDPHSERRQWAESGMLGDNGGTLIVLHGADRAGAISWRRVQTGPTAFSWAIGIGLAQQFRGRGIGSEAHRLLARYLFAHTQVNRIEAATEITNVAEQRALEKAGLTREGVLRGSTFRQGQWHDQVLYSVLRDEIKLDEAATVPDEAPPGRPTKQIDSAPAARSPGEAMSRLDKITDPYAPVRLASRDVSRPLVIGTRSAQQPSNWT